MFRRRSMLSVAAAATVTLALAGCAPTTSASAGGDSQSAGAKGTVTVFISGDTNIQTLWQDALIPAFEKANPGTTVKTTLDLHGEHDAQTLAKLASATKAGDAPGYDLIDSGFIQAAGDSGLLTKVSSTTIPNLASVPSTTVAAGKGYGIPYRASSVLLAYDSTKVSTPPKTLDALLAWIKANPGQFAYNSPSTGGAGGAFVTTVLDRYLSDADRTTLETKYDKSLESKWDKGFTTLAALNSSVYQKGVYPNGNQQVIDLLGSGGVSMAPVWSDQVISAQDNGTLPKTIKYTQISDPAFTGSPSYLGIPKTSTHAAIAEKLADYVLSPAGQALIASKIAGYPVVKVDGLKASTVAKFSGADPNNLRPGYYSETASDMSNLWDQKVPGQ